MSSDDVAYVIRKVGADRFEQTRRATDGHIQALEHQSRLAGGPKIVPEIVSGTITLLIALANLRASVHADDYNRAIGMVRATFMRQFDPDAS